MTIWYHTETVDNIDIYTYKITRYTHMTIWYHTETVDNIASDRVYKSMLCMFICPSICTVLSVCVYCLYVFIVYTVYGAMCVCLYDFAGPADQHSDHCQDSTHLRTPNRPLFRLTLPHLLLI